jgi:hypothetical protein
MVVTLTPAMAFATSTNTVASVPTVKGDAVIPADTVITLTVNDTTGWEANKEQKIKLSISNGKWDTNPTEAGTDTNANSLGYIKDSEFKSVLTATANTGDDNVNITADFISSTDTSLEFSFKPSADIPKDGYVLLTIGANNIKTEDEDGPVEIAIDGLDSKVTTKTLTIATVGTSTTTATVNGDVKSFARGSITTSNIKTSIEIRETAVNSILKDSVQTFEIKLPKGVTWTEGSGASTFGGDMATISSSNVEYTDSRTMKVTATITGSDDVRNVLTITPAIEIGSDATMGDIAVQITSKSAVYNNNDTDAIADASDLVIAKYGEESVEITTISDIPEIVSGYKQSSKDKTFYVYATLKESMGGALSSGRYVDFDLPEEVQIKGPIAVSNTKGDGGTFSTANTSAISVGEDSISNASVGAEIKSNGEVVGYTGLGSDCSSFTFKIPTTGNSIGGNSWKTTANTITFKIPVTVEADFTGDINLEVSGAKAGIDDTDLVVATAKSPITVETSTTDVKNGVQKQSVANITITEVEPGYLDDNTNLVIDLDDLGLTNALVFDDADVAVTDGNIELGKTTITKGSIIIPIKSASTKVSKIEITNISATLNRTLPEGKYDLLVGGSALITNESYNDEDFDVTPVTSEGYINIVTPAESTTVTEKVDAQFVIGQTSYTNNGESVTMDAAPYIANSRTMVPIRYVANACGISEEDITWNDSTKTATINGLNTVVTIKMGSNTIQTSNGTITMDTVAVNNNGRIYVPLRFIANALGANVAWDASTKTITLTK